MATKSQYYVGQDGNIYISNKLSDGKFVSAGPKDANGQLAAIKSASPGIWTEVADPNATNTSTVDPNAARAAGIRGDIKARGGDIDAIYGALFGDLDNLGRERGTELESTYGDQLKKATGDYTAAIPTIEQSYASLGAADSTDRADAKDKAKAGFEDTTTTIGKNKQDDLAKLGEYLNEQRATLTAGRDSAARNVARADETTDPDALNGFRSDLETNLDQAGVTRAQLGTNGSARQAVSSITGDNGRFDAASSALDSILKSSMSGAVKDAAVNAVTTSAGLSDADKKKIQTTYGNTYAEQAAL